MIEFAKEVGMASCGSCWVTWSVNAAIINKKQRAANHVKS